MQGMSQDQGDQQSGTVYNMVALTPGLADKVFGDSSPETVINEIWEFLNHELMTANLREIDVEDMMDRTEIRFINMLCGIPEDRWDQVRIAEQEWVEGPDGKPILQTVRVFYLTELWDALLAKVKIKCLNSRNGFLLKTITESRQHVEQLYEERGVNRPPEYTVPGQPTQTQGGGGWKP